MTQGLEREKTLGEGQMAKKGDERMIHSNDTFYLLPVLFTFGPSSYGHLPRG